MGIVLEPIGLFRADEILRRHALPRQPGSRGISGRVELEAGRNFEQALRDVEDFERVWLLYVFHENSGWKPQVRPPGQTRKRGLFATRAPYRPNPIGLSCVSVESVEGRVLKVSGCDLLDGTPILDIKPYVAYADAYPDSKGGWIERAQGPEGTYNVSFSGAARMQLELLRDLGGADLAALAERVLGVSPEPSSCNRVERRGRDGVYACGTWRLDFELQGQEVLVTKLRSGYSIQELEVDEDPWGDKELHRLFLRKTR